VLAVGLVAIWSTGVHDLVRPERIAVLRQWVDAWPACAGRSSRREASRSRFGRLRSITTRA